MDQHELRYWCSHVVYYSNRLLDGIGVHSVRNPGTSRENT